MTSALDVVDAAVRAAGAVRVQTPAEIVQVARLVMSADLPAGGRVAVVGDSGGQTGIAADLASAARAWRSRRSPVRLLMCWRRCCPTALR